MREITIPLPSDTDSAVVERAIDGAIADCLLAVCMRASLKKFPGCVHWHVKRGRATGTLEVTYWPRTLRAWICVQDGRKAPWIDAAIPLLLNAIKRRVGLKLRPITPARAATFKAVRLRALRDSPEAFGSTYAAESRLSDDDWKKRARKWSGSRSAGFLAFDEENACGIAAAFLDNEDVAKARLISMWVAPTHRQRGIGRMLVHAVIHWAKGKHVRALHLMVVSSNVAAMEFYERLGFARSGRTEPYPHDPALLEYEMARSIGD